MMYLTRRWLAVVLLSSVVWCGVSSSFGEEPPAETARQLIEELGVKVVDLLSDPEISLSERETRFRGIFREFFAVESVARWIVGRHWRRAAPAERADYLELFEDLIVLGHANRFQAYAGQNLAVQRALEPEGDVVTVFSEIKQPTSETRIDVTWRVGFEDGEFRIVDVIVQGTSLSQTLRSDFASTLRQRGGTLGGLNEALREKIAELNAPQDDA